MNELPKLKPLMMKERLSVLFVEKGNLDVLDGAFVVVDKNGVRTHIPVGRVACLMSEPGTRVSHAAVTLASRVGCLLVWTGQAGVRLYASGQPGGARADRLLYQAKLALDDEARLKVVRKMYAIRFGEEPRQAQRGAVEGHRGPAGEADVPAFGPKVQSGMETPELRLHRMGERGYPKLVPFSGYGQPLRHHGGRYLGGRLRPRHRVHPYGQAAFVRL